MEKPKLEEYLELVKSSFQIELSDDKINVLTDIYKLWEKIEEQADKGILTIYMETSILKSLFKHEFQYHFWLGLKTIVFLIGLICFIFNWKIAIVMILLTLIIHYYSKRIKIKEIKIREKIQIDSIKNRDYNKGLIGFSIYYILGAYQIKTQFGSVAFPEKISKILF